MSSIRIISTPPGEAPLEIREAWIGLVLPLAEPKIRKGLAFGVLSAPNGILKQGWEILMGRAQKTSSYVVNAKTAIEILESANPAAATWWRENTPHLLAPYRKFGLALEACELISEKSSSE
jgi:hypothetical protein